MLAVATKSSERTNERNKIDGSIIFDEMTPERRRDGRRTTNERTGWSPSPSPSQQLMGWLMEIIKKS